MTVIFWKKANSTFNGLVGKTSLDLAVERYVSTHSQADLEHVQMLLSIRRPMNANEKKPLDVVVERVAQTGNEHDFRMLQALVKKPRGYR